MTSTTFINETSSVMKEVERLRVLLTTTNQHRESWKVRALMAEAQLLEATAKTGNKGDGENVSDVRYASLKRYLASRFHPDYAPGQGIEKIVRNEVFKEISTKIARQRASDALAISIPRTEAAVIRHFQAHMPYELVVPDVL